MSTAELACSYAALILADEDVEITVHPLPSPTQEKGTTITAKTSQANESTYVHTGRQAPNHHQSRQRQRRRAHLDFPLRQGKSGTGLTPTETTEI